MKKTLFFLGCMALLLAGCNKVMPEEDPTEDPPRHLAVDIQVSIGSDTRAVKTEWRAGDKVYVVFDSFWKIGSNEHLTLTYNGSSWINEFSSSGLEQYLLDHANDSGDKSLTAVYLSDDLDPVFKYYHDRYDLNGSDILEYGISMQNHDELKGFYMYANDKPYTVVDGKLTAEVNLILPERTVHFFIGNISADKAANYTLSCPNLFPFHFRSIYVWGYYGNPIMNGPYVDFAAIGSGEPIAAWPHDGGIAFVCGIRDSVPGQEAEYFLTVVDNNGTPNDTTDDKKYMLRRTDILIGKEAIRLPDLSNYSWNVNTGNVNPVYGGYNDMIQW